MEKNEQSLKTNFHKTIFRSPPWQTKARSPRPGELLHSTSDDRPLDYWKVHDGVGGFLGQFESQSECECESKCEFGLEFTFLRPAACAPCQKITRTAAFCNNNRRCLAQDRHDSPPPPPHLDSVQKFTPSDFHKKLFA